MSSALDAHVVVTRDGFSLDAPLAVEAGQTLAVMGPSGAGKSTLLGAIAGLIPISTGHIALDGRVLDDGARVSVAPNRRGVVLLGQDPRLFPHLTARDNIAFGLRAQGTSRAKARAEAERWVDRVGLGGLGHRRPDRLSGGQQQRVAIARALAAAPGLILLDEPLTALDVQTSADIRALLREQLAQTTTSAVVATHDAVDAVALASTLVALEAGAVSQHGGIREVLAAPATAFVAAVAGLNRVVGRIEGDTFTAGDLVAPAPAGRPSGEAVAVFPPSAVRLDDTAGQWRARIARLEPTPGGVRVRLAAPDIVADVAADALTERALDPNTTVFVRVDPAAIRIL